MPRRALIMVAGGTGTRMQSKLAKQFLKLGDLPIIMHSFNAFRHFDPEMEFVLVLYKDLEEEWKALCKLHDFDLDHKLVEGGAERFHSVKNGLDALDSSIDLVAIHDAVRPLVSQDTIARSFKVAEEQGAAIPTIPVVDTIRQESAGQNKTLARHELKAVQTPQCFQLESIKKAYDVPFDPQFTDDASVAEKNGIEVHCVDGNRTNIKITTAEDLLVAEAFLKFNSKNAIGQ